jgi:hypothetical protein
MRLAPWFLATLAVACHPSATIQRTMPIASLQSYRTVSLRVQATGYGSTGYARFFESAVLAQLQAQCGFEQILRPDKNNPADVLLDLNITGMRRGSTGIVQNPNQANMEMLLVLTDGAGELLGTAKIHGQSSGLGISTGSPENEAINIVAKSVGDLLSKSGCSGPRIAKVEPPQPPQPPHDGSGSGSGSATVQPPDETKRPDAEALNESGKDKLRSADVPGALAAFQQANAMLPDAKYAFNICLAYQAEEQWNDALATCKKAKDMNPQGALASKIDHQIDVLAHR